MKNTHWFVGLIVPLTFMVNSCGFTVEEESSPAETIEVGDEAALKEGSVVLEEEPVVGMPREEAPDPQINESTEPPVTLQEFEFLPSMPFPEEKQRAVHEAFTEFFDGLTNEELLTFMEQLIVEVPINTKKLYQNYPDLAANLKSRGVTREELQIMFDSEVQSQE